MKKIFITSLLIISIFAGLQSNQGYTGEVIYAKAATVAKNNLSKPKMKAVYNSANKVQLSINKVAGATKYKVYRATSKNGKYKCIGTTKSNTYTDNVKNGKTYYYKVKACNTVNTKEVKSPFSKLVTVKTTPKTNTGNVTQKPTSAPKPTATPVTNTSVTNSSNQSYANEVLKLINQERAKAGLKALTTTTSLQNAANKRALETVTSFSHTRPDGRSFSTVFADYGISYRAAGENIAEGQRTPSEVMNAWMNSPGHRANILGSQFGKVGVGVYKSAQGRYYWTQEFMN